MIDNNKLTPAQNKLVTYLIKRDPKLKKDDLISLLSSIKRFVTVVQKIYTEPQARMYYKEVDENGKKVKKRYIDTNIEELLKVKRAPKEPITIKTFRELTQKITGVKPKTYGK